MPRPTLSNAQIRRLIPLLVILVIALLLATGLFNRDRNRDALNMLGMNFAPFTLPNLTNPNVPFSDTLWRDRVAMVSVFASWCEPCAIEHPALMQLAQTGKLPIYGIAWKDKPEKIAAWLNKHGNPYQQIGIDTGGKMSIPMGLTGVPETFLLDRSGRIVFHSREPLTELTMQQTLLPLINQLTQ